MYFLLWNFSLFLIIMFTTGAMLAAMLGAIRGAMLGAMLGAMRGAMLGAGHQLQAVVSPWHSYVTNRCVCRL
jgi:hypothetical protein